MKFFTVTSHAAMLTTRVPDEWGVHNNSNSHEFTTPDDIRRINVVIKN